MQTKTDFSSPTLSLMEDEPYYHYYDMYNNTETSNSSIDRLEGNIQTIAIIIFTFSVCIIGLGGNGIVIFILGFHVKRSPFTTYILNLAVADFGVLLFTSLDIIINRGYFPGHPTIIKLATFMYANSQLLLTAISIDRCVAVLFPIWHRCHRPPHLSTTVCALIWILNSLQIGSIAHLTLSTKYSFVFFLQFVVSAILCLPLVTISTLILLFKVSCKLQQLQRRKLLYIVLLTLLFFLLFGYPLSAIVIFNYFTSVVYQYPVLVLYGFLCACLNSCVNPVIYYLVGRNKRGQQSQSLKVVLQRAFKEEEEQREERGPTAQTQL